MVSSILPPITKLTVPSVNKNRNTFSRIEATFVELDNKWTGCDWDTEFGSAGLNLRGLTANRANVLANATSGEEANAWSDAKYWLVNVENDAAKAKSLAAEAVTQYCKQSWDVALELIERACTIESAHHTKLIWQPLRDLIALPVEQVDCTPHS